MGGIEGEGRTLSKYCVSLYFCDSDKHSCSELNSEKKFVLDDVYYRTLPLWQVPLCR